MNKTRTKPIPERKTRAVEELAKLLKEKKTVLIASIKNLPGSQFQEIRKNLRGKAIIKVPKKNIILRAIDAAESSKKFVKQIKEDVAILFSDLDCFELAGELVENKSPAKAKAGQEAPEDIEVEEGPTELIPGPAVSELGALGIPIQIQEGKIHIKTSKVIVKKGEKISDSAASLMNKLGIEPFLVGFEPLAAFDNQEKKLYLDIKIDKAQTIKELKTAFGKALPFAVEIGYVCEDTIKFTISKAGIHEKVLEKLENSDEKVEEKKEEVTKDNKVEQPSDSEANKSKHASEIKSGEDK